MPPASIFKEPEPEVAPAPTDFSQAAIPESPLEDVQEFVHSPIVEPVVEDISIAESTIAETSTI